MNRDEIHRELDSISVPRARGDEPAAAPGQNHLSRRKSLTKYSKKPFLIV